MNSYIKDKIKILIGLILLALFISLVVVGQRTVSYPSLGLMLLGLAGILLLLYLYNRSYTKAKTSNEEEQKEENHYKKAGEK